MPDAAMADWPWPITIGIGAVALASVVAIVVRNWPRANRDPQRRADSSAAQPDPEAPDDQP